MKNRLRVLRAEREWSQATPHMRTTLPAYDSGVSL